MKNVIFLLIGLLQLPLLPAAAGGTRPSGAQRFTLTAWGGLHAFANQNFKKIYGNNQPEFGLDLGFRLGRKASLFVAVAHLAAEGELTYSREETSFRLTGLEAGAAYSLPLGRLAFFVGAGAGYYWIREKNIIASLDEKKGGFFALGGLRFHFSRALFAAAQLKYVFLELAPLDKKVDLGGWFAGGGLGVSF